MVNIAGPARGVDPLVVGNSTNSVLFASALSVGALTAPSTSALVDMQSTTKGLLPPRLTTTQRDTIPSPAPGLVVFNTTSQELNVFADGAWTTVSGGPSVDLSNYVLRAGDTMTGALAVPSISRSSNGDLSLAANAGGIVLTPHTAGGHKVQVAGPLQVMGKFQLDAGRLWSVDSGTNTTTTWGAFATTDSASAVPVLSIECGTKTDLDDQSVAAITARPLVHVKNGQTVVSELDQNGRWTQNGKLHVSDATDSTGTSSDAAIKTAGGVSVAKDIHCETIHPSNGIKMVWGQFVLENDFTGSGPIPWTLQSQSSHGRFQMLSAYQIDVTVPGAIYRVSGLFNARVDGTDNELAVRFASSGSTLYQCLFSIVVETNELTYGQASLECFHSMSPGVGYISFNFSRFRGSSILVGKSSAISRTMFTIMQVG